MPIAPKLKRIAPGYYKTVDERYIVQSMQHDDGKVWWGWKTNTDNGCCEDLFATKWETVEALAHWIAGLK